MGMLAASPCEHMFDTLGSPRCVSPARVGIWDVAAGIWLFEVTFADPCQLSFKVFHLSSTVKRKLKSSILVCVFCGVSGHLFSLMCLKKIISFCTGFVWELMALFASYLLFQLLIF